MEKLEGVNVKKITPELLEKIQKLSGKKSVSDIAKKTSLSVGVVRYWLHEEARENQRERCRKRSKKLYKARKLWNYTDREKRNEWQNKYYRERYHNDPEFRAKRILWSSEWKKRVKKNESETKSG